MLKRLSEHSDLEVHVFGSAEGVTGGDQVVGSLRPAVQHWHEVRNRLACDHQKWLRTLSVMRWGHCSNGAIYGRGGGEEEVAI